MAIRCSVPPPEEREHVVVKRLNTEAERRHTELTPVSERALVHVLRIGLEKHARIFGERRSLVNLMKVIECKKRWRPATKIKRVESGELGVRLELSQQTFDVALAAFTAAGNDGKIAVGTDS